MRKHFNIDICQTGKLIKKSMYYHGFTYRWQQCVQDVYVTEEEERTGTIQRLT